MMNKEILKFDFEVRAKRDEQHGTYLEGTPIVYDAWTDLGWYDEQIQRGALDNTDLTDVRFLINHNTDMIPLARSRNNNANSTMQLEVVEGQGLDIRVNLDTENNADAKALYSAVERNDIDKMSFMFIVESDKWDDVDSEHPTRTITGIRRVLEVSAVTWPAYSATSIQARGLSDALESAKASLESVKAAKRELELAKAKLKMKARI